MRTRSQIIEVVVEQLASAALAGSCAYATWAAMGRPLTALALAISSAIAAIVYLLCLRSIARIDVALTFAMPSFEAAVLPKPVEQDELLLTEADCLPISVAAVEEEPLLLDDVLAGLDADSRVVRLFDPARMPTPGQLDARIREHLDSPRAAAAPPDASHMLHEALAELRRSLR